jgi:RNA polymerase sigma-70 factor, ECF subfamily
MSLMVSEPTVGPELTDEALASRAARGDHAAFEALVRRHAGPLLAFCRRLLGDATEAEDRVQEAFMRAFRNLDRFDASRRFGSWLYRIAQNACVDTLRARRDWAPIDEVDPPGRDAAPLTADASPALTRAVSELPARQRAVVHLKYTLGLDALEIAERLDMTPGNVRVVLHRAIKTLREALSP